VINGKANVDSGLRDRVLKAIESLGFRPNSSAQNMRRGSTHLIGCVVREINIPALASFVSVAHDILAQNGYSLLLSNSSGSKQVETDLLERLSRLQCDGFILGSYAPLDEHHERFLRSLNAPIVSIDRDKPDWLDSVMADHAGAIRVATKRLIELGHRKIALLTGGATLYPAQERIRGFSEAFQQADIEIPVEFIRNPGFARDDGFRATSAMLAENNPPTAIIAGGSDMVSGVLHAIRVRGLSIPGDISVVGGGDTSLSELHVPPISVCTWSQAEMSKCAMQLLLDRIADPDLPPKHLVIPTEFIERGSLASPR
jgi:LacI family transcriptional regulator